MWYERYGGLMKKAAYTFAVLSVVLAGAIAQQKKAVVNDEAALRAIEDKWDAASVKGDVATLGAIFHDSFISTNTEGLVHTKAEMLNEIKSGAVKYESSKVEDLKFYFYGNAAVVTGKWSGKVIEQGKPVESAERFTDMFIKEKGQWRCVAAHASPIH
jgi:ketosteroid isomerase-like protein